jgi:hypothetical protein
MVMGFFVPIKETFVSSWIIFRNKVDALGGD